MIAVVPAQAKTRIGAAQNTEALNVYAVGSTVLVVFNGLGS